MSGMLCRESGGGFRGWAAGAVLCLAACAGVSAAQTTVLPPPAPAPMSASPAGAAPTSVAAGDVDGSVVQAQCAGCSAGLLGTPAPEVADIGGCSSCGCNGGCVPGRKPCDCCCDSECGPGRFLCGIYQCICCPDHCYEPQWNALADASFFQTTGPRPITQMQFRYEQNYQIPFPDKAEFLMARADNMGKGPMPPTPVVGRNYADDRELHMYTEAGNGRFGAWVDLPYENISFDNYRGASGIGDLSFGTKSLLLDCELLQFAFEFNTYTPTGNFTRGLGTGHVSLEPGFLIALKLAPETYLQSELAYRFPLGGDQAFEGAVFHYHLSLNQLLWNCGHDIKLIGTAEMNGYEFLDGQYTGPGNIDVPLASSPDGNVLNFGPGVRLVICDKIDFGVAGAFNVTSGSIGNQILNAQFRWRF